MAKKTGARTAQKQFGNFIKKHERLSDEIDLRDEILELKRQILMLKKENEQYLVKLRKYEDEAKRKDQQLEELMDPRKNADVTKVLSTKGAVILMNLKDQNNALIQIILKKDLHIRRLITELKTTKLYASTRKNETYRAEINRLKNLLMNLEETLKENFNVQAQRSIFAEGNSLLEMTSSSSQSSPRDPDELRQTISSLESYIKHSNDLLIKKNQEISLLSDKVKFYQKFFHHETATDKAFDLHPTELKNKISVYLTCGSPVPLSQIEISNQDVLDIFEKNMNQEDQSQLHLPTSTQRFSSIDSIQKYGFQKHFSKEETQHQNESSFTVTNKKTLEIVPVTGKSLFHNLAITEIKKEEKMYANYRKVFRTQEKWKRALKKYRELESSEWRTAISDQAQMKNNYERNENGNETEFSKENKETNELQDVAKETLNYQILEKDEIKSDVITETPISPKLFNDNQKSKTQFVISSNDVTTISKTLSCHKTNESHQKQMKDEDHHKMSSVSQGETSHDDKENAPKNSPTGQISRFKIAPHETESKKILSEIHLQSSSSSFDSESSYSTKQEVQQVQVEAQINLLSFQSDSDQFENNEIFEYNEESRGNSAPDLTFNDDDDVIIRE